MGLPSTGLTGMVTSEVRFHEGGSVPSAYAQMKFSERRLDRDTGKWGDGRVLWIGVKAWRASALRLRHLAKGAVIYVQGEIVTEQWTDKQTQEQRETIVFHARELYEVVTDQGPQGAAGQAGSPSDGSYTPDPMAGAGQSQFAGTWGDPETPADPVDSTFKY